MNSKTNKFLPTQTLKLLKLAREGDVITVVCSTGTTKKFQVVQRVTTKGRPSKNNESGGGTTLTVVRSDKQITFKLNKYILPEGWHAVTDLENNANTN